MSASAQIAPSTRQFSLKPLMFETFVCTMAVMAFVALAGSIARVLHLAPWQMGLAVTAAGVAWMALAPVWGTLSDRRGRRPIILFGLAGFAVSYALFVLFIDLALRTTMAPALAFVGIVLGRGLAGAFYAAVPATSAALVADHVPPERRAGAMAAIGASSAAGMVIGPGFAGLLGPTGLSLPLYLIAVLPVIALAVLWRVLPSHEPQPASGKRAPRLTDARLRRPLVMGFIAAFGVSVAQITVGFFALDRLHLDPGQAANTAGVALATVGVVLVCAQIALRKLNWPVERLIRIGSVVAGVGFASTVLATAPVMLWASYAVAAFGMGWVYPSISALAANSVEAHEQGAAAGAVAAAQGLGIILGPVLGTAIYVVDNGLPYALIAIMLLLSAIWCGRGTGQTRYFGGR